MERVYEPFLEQKQTQKETDFQPCLSAEKWEIKILQMDLSLHQWPSKGTSYIVDWDERSAEQATSHHL